jgi:hypothetical protein
MTTIILDASPDTVKITSGLEVTDPAGAGVIISSEGGGDMTIKASSGGSWQGPLRLLDEPNGNVVADFSNQGVGFYGAPAVAQADRVGPITTDLSFSEIIAKFNALELVLHNLGLTK